MPFLYPSGFICFFVFYQNLNGTAASASQPVGGSPGGRPVSGIGLFPGFTNKSKRNELSIPKSSKRERANLVSIEGIIALSAASVRPQQRAAGCRQRIVF